MSGIFKAYDIRGAYPEALDENIARRIGAAFVRYLHAKRIVIGRDMRLSSPALAEAFIQSVLESGCDVTDIGTVTSPLLYFAVIDGRYDGGAMVTASHLPAAINGFKLCRREAVPLSRDQGLPDLEQAVMEMESPQSSDKKGIYEERRILGKYIDELGKFVFTLRPLKIVVDAGNGTVGPELVELLRRFPAWRASTLCMEPDGRFPHHVANPLLPVNTRDLQEKVRAEGADIGIAFDGDADRCGFINERGERVQEDLVTAFLSEYYLTKEPGQKVLYDLRSSRAVPETIRRFGGVPIRSRVGHSFIKEKMREEDAVFAGELSGHYYYRDTGFTDNALFTMIQMLNFLGGKNETLSEIMAPLQKYSSTGEINLKTSQPEAVFKFLEKSYRDAEQDYLDGLSVCFDTWWFNLRSSNTEPLMRLNLEANTPESRDLKRKEVLGFIREADAETEVISSDP